MKVIYVAGPYRAKSEWEVVQNIRMAEKAAGRVLDVRTWEEMPKPVAS